MIRKEMTHTFSVDIQVTRQGDEFLVTVLDIDSDGGPFHTPASGPLETDRILVQEIADDPVVGDRVTVDGSDGPVDAVTEEAVIAYIMGDEN